MKIPIITSIAALISITLVSAYTWGNRFGFYGSPLDYLDNEWVRFATIFLILFALIFFAINKSLKGNRGVAIVIATGLTILITTALARRGWLYSYAGDELGSWITFVAFLLVLGFLLKTMWENFGKVGVITSIFILWLLIRYIDVYDYLPYQLSWGGFEEFIGAIATLPGLIILIVIALILSSFLTKGENTIEKITKHLLKPN